MSITITNTECQCEIAGYCKLMRRECDPPQGRLMREARYDECKNRPNYFEMFLSESENPCRGSTIKNDATPINKWACGITTVPSRLNNEFRRTMESLKQAGFDKPTIFVDAPSGDTDYDKFGLPVVHRESNIKTAGHWVLSAWELYIRNSHAEYFAMFQDDFVACKNLRQYIELSDPPMDGYLNLYTFPQNQKRADRQVLKGRYGWFKSNQKGLGAVALVFPNEVFRKLISHEHLRERFRSKKPSRNGRMRRDTNIDGGIVDSIRKAGLYEYCHSPSLVQHIGQNTSMGSLRQPRAPRFAGEDFDAIEFLPEENRPKPTAKKPYELGDAVSDALSSVGVTPDKVSRWIGAPCGCKERKEKLNKLSRWAKESTKKSLEDSKSTLKRLIGMK